MSNKNYRVEDLAAWFLNKVDEDAGDSITHLKLQKLVYYAQAWSLAIYDQPFFDEEFEAWARWPVVKSLWNKYKGSYIISEKPVINKEFAQEEEELLNEVWEIYWNLTWKKLEDLTHSEEPWIEARWDISEGAICENKISKETMKEFYRKINDNGEK